MAVVGLLRQPEVVPDEPPEQYFRERGFDLIVREVDLHAQYMASGEPGRASFFQEGRRYFSIDLVRDGTVVGPDYAHGETVAEAIRRARIRFGSEQT